MIPPQENGEFVARMERVLDVYKRPYDPLHPVVCMDESPLQLIRETRPSLAARSGDVACYDYEYERCGVCNVFMAVDPLAGKRIVEVTARRTKQDWAQFIEQIARWYPKAEKITLVMDNLNTHSPGSFYVLRDVLSNCGQGAVGPLRVRLYSPAPSSSILSCARKLAEHRGDRTERARSTVPGPKDRYVGGDPDRDPSLAEPEEQRWVSHRLAVHRPRRQDQAKAALSDTQRMTRH